MTIAAGKGYWRRVLASCLMTIDCFLWATGNPSITGHIGLFWLTPIAILMTIAASAPGEGLSWKPFGAHVLIVASACVVLTAVGPYAEGLAAQRMDAEANSFVRDPSNDAADATNDQRQLMMAVKRKDYTMQRETFIPTDRRMDYLLAAVSGEKYRLSVMMGWTDRAKIWLHRVE